METDWTISEELNTSFDVTSEDGDWGARILWDGSMFITDLESVSVDPDCPDRLHLGSAKELDMLIERLMKLRELARAKFAKHHYEAWT